MSLDVGATIRWGSERYEILELLSEGGFGRAFRANRITPASTTPTQVVIKVPADHVVADPVWSKKFEREARILANISHTNVVKIIAFWPKIQMKNGATAQALVQELVSGAKDLPDYIKANQSAAASLFLQTLYALRAFHGASSPSAVHRDLSPRNILISDAGVVKVIDFGLAKEDPRATQVLTQKGEWFGTPGCMSPEQLHDAASVDHRTDLFALGRSFAAALQGRHPAAANPSKLPDPWKDLCLKLTEDDPDDRFATAEETLSAAMAAFAAAGVAIDNFDFHLEEMRGQPVIAGWPELCDAHFTALPDFDQRSLELMCRVATDVFKPPFNADALLTKLEASSAITNIAAGTAPYEDADAIGTIYVDLYPNLDPQNKLTCFTRLCRTAVREHRYYVMGAVRRAYAKETDPAVKAQLVAILDTEDPPPTSTIHGRGVLPRVP